MTKRAVLAVGLMASILSAPGFSVGQEKTVAQEKKPVPLMPTPLKVDVVINEFDGAKKVGSLPYSFHIASDDGGRQSLSQVRVGLRVPVNTSPTQYQYFDIGTNVDCNATSDNGRFRLALSIDRTYLYNAPSAGEKNAPEPVEQTVLKNPNPIIAHFSSNYALFIRDGQTVEATSTTDPISGRVLKVQVTLNTVK